MKLLHSFAQKNFVVFLLMIVALMTQAQTPAKVYVLKWHDQIDESSDRYLQLGLNKAEKDSADLIILDLHTPGGTVVHADHMRFLLLNCKIPLAVWINKEAFSAGALISIACDSIYMNEGGVIGASTVVTFGMEVLPEKIQSAMRAKMRATAETTHRDPVIAEGMVGILGPDSMSIAKVISLTTQEALAKDYCDGVARNIEDVLRYQKIGKYEITYYEPSAYDNIMGFLLQPWIRGLLILLMIGGLIMEMKSPGLGLPIVVSLTAAALYFIPSYETGLAQNWEILVFVAGVILIALEIFVVPGFGVTGVAGIIFTMAGLILVTLNNDWLDFSFVSEDEIYQSVFITMLSIALSIVFLLIASRFIIRSKFFKRVSLQTTLGSGSGFTTEETLSMIGKTGKAYSVLRPSGKVIINDQVYDASTGGEYIEKGQDIEVTGENINSLKVKKI